MKKVNSLETNAYGHFMRPFFANVLCFEGKKERKKERNKERKKERKK
jgi:hypothetical protein